MKNKQKTVVIVSGYFNPIHSGHIDLLREAKRMGDVLEVIVNSDFQVGLKKSVPFMDEKERQTIVHNISYVNASMIAIDKDKTVCKTIEAITKTYDYRWNIIFANGGDRKKQKDIPEAKVCKKLGIEMVFNVGGGKTQSSSILIKNAAKKVK